MSLRKGTQVLFVRAFEKLFHRFLPNSRGWVLQLSRLFWGIGGTACHQHSYGNKTGERAHILSFQKYSKHMIRSKTVTHIAITITLTLLSLFPKVQAQGILDLSGSAYLDNILGTLRRDDAQIGLFSTNALGAKGWQTPVFSAQYSFTHRDSKLIDDTQTDTHGVSPELSFSHASGFAFSSGLSYSHSESKSMIPSEGNVDTFGVTFGPSMDLGRFCRQLPSKLKLSGGVLFGYSYADSQNTAGGVVTETTRDTWSVGPHFVANYQFTPNTAFSIVPGYGWEVTDNNPALATRHETSAGRFTLLGRFDASLRTDLLLSLAAQWKKDIAQDVAPGGTVEKHNWAEFTSYLTYKIPKGPSVRAGYGIEAFRRDFLAHKVTARLAVSF